MKYAVLVLAFLWPQDENPHHRKWVVQFQVDIKNSAENPDPPLIYMNLLVKAPTEGAATIAALLQAQDLLMPDAQKKLKFVAACLKEEK